MQYMLKTLIICAAVLVAAVSFAETKSGQVRPSSSKLAAAERLAAKGRTEEALKVYRELLKENPDNKAIMRSAADLQAKLGRFNEAALLYAELFRSKVRKLRAQRQRELSGEALKLYHRIDTMRHGNPRVCIGIADDLMSMGKLDWARQELEKALEIDPGSSDAYFYLGKNYQLKGDPRAAVTALEKAVALNPRNYYARNNLGGLYIQMDRLDLAAQQFSAAIELKKDNSLSYYNLGLVCALKDEYPRAVRCLKDAIAYAPGDMNAHELLANIYFERMQDYASARPLYEKILREKGDITGREALKVQERIRQCSERMPHGGMPAAEKKE